MTIPKKAQEKAGRVFRCGGLVAGALDGVQMIFVVAVVVGFALKESRSFIHRYGALRA